MIFEKINEFSEGKYTIDVPATQIASDFEEKRGDSAAVIEALSITQRFISTCKQLGFPALSLRLNPYSLSQTCLSESSIWTTLRRPRTLDSIIIYRRFTLRLLFECPLQEGA